MPEETFEAQVLSALASLETKIDGVAALVRALAEASGNSSAQLRAAASELGIVHMLDPGHNEVDPE